MAVPQPQKAAQATPQLLLTDSTQLLAITNLNSSTASQPLFHIVSAGVIATQQLAPLAAGHQQQRQVMLA
jgi:hypothetical protein